MRDGLTAALQAAFDPAVTRVVVRGAGRSFCSGGDLDEFGTRPDPATAHLVRLTRSAARLVHRLGAKVEFELHGWCIGAGIELPSFAGTVRAAADTSIVLPEVRFGLVPGAGGTVSLPRRIGRQRTAWLGLTGSTLDATTALEWGLVDALEDAATDTV
jgi:enoyl-CoA hydratase/carnithine racemase